MQYQFQKMETDHNNIINMYFPSTPSKYGNISAKLSPKTAASENKSSFFRSKTYIDDMRGSLNNLIYESQHKKNAIDSALTEVWKTNQEAISELGLQPRVSSFDNQSLLQTQLDEALRENTRLRIYIAQLEDQNQRLRAGGFSGPQYGQHILRELENLKQEGDQLRYNTTLLLRKH